MFSLTEVNERPVESAMQDQTARMYRLILLYIQINKLMVTNNWKRVNIILEFHSSKYFRSKLKGRSIRLSFQGAIFMIYNCERNDRTHEERRKFTKSCLYM